MSKLPKMYRDDFKQYLVEVLVKIGYDKLYKLYTKGDMDKFVMTIIKNQISNSGQYRRKVMMPFFIVNITEYKSNTIDEIVDDTNDEENEIRSEESLMLDRIDILLLHLDPIKVFVFNLYYKRGMNYRQISEYTGSSISSIQKKIYYIKNKIKDSI